MAERNPTIALHRVEDVFAYSEIKQGLWNILERVKEHVRVPQHAVAMIKVNLCLLKGPETGATVEPMVARALIEWLDATYNLKKIYVAEADATHLGAEMAFKVLGWAGQFKNVPKVELFNLTSDKTMRVKSKYLKDLEMSRTMMESDLLISLAKLKTHTQQKITGIMKNQFGAIPYKYKIIYHPILGEAIYDAVTARLPDLCIIDGLIAMEGNGPTNGIPRRTKLLLVSDDAFAMDHYCARLMGFKPMSIPHLRIATKNGLGNSQYEIVGAPPNPVNLNFKFLPKWKDIIKKGIRTFQGESINEEA